VNEAHKLFPQWKSVTAEVCEGDQMYAGKSHFETMAYQQRSDVMKKWHQLLLDHEQDLATIITFENGNSLLDAFFRV
jgi:acyl-CoA reductase-like NAD-dependent aldehyde dehydrogenase